MVLHIFTFLYFLGGCASILWLDVWMDGWMDGLCYNMAR